MNLSRNILLVFASEHVIRMKKLFACLALVFLAPLLGSLHAQDGQQPSEQYEPPPPEGIDVDYFAPPKQKLSVGLRYLSGPKVSFSGSGNIPAQADPSADSTTTGRTYNDGTVSPDTRNGGLSTNDGRTNTWSYDSASQALASGGVDMHAYSAEINGNNTHGGQANLASGVEATYERDFGWHIGRIQFDLIAGLAINKISYSRSSQVDATLTTLTDHYNAYNPILDSTGTPVTDSNGNPTYPTTPSTTPVPAAPYVAPSADTNGNANTTLLDSEPATSSTNTQETQATDQWTINGAYFTLRAGPQMTVPFTKNFSASVSGGPALLYVGTTFTVNQTLTPPTGSSITSTVSDDYYTVLPACFADADLEYSLTETTGLYLGAIFQSSTGYNQSIHSLDGNYTNRVEFGNEEGVRGGINFKF
ncbi:MAG: hypothetical protein ABSE59_06540 [Opitutaceae bacterium]|jgi:hypothetical protein